jgi:hypothetical protein
MADLNGYQVHQQVASFGCGNVFSGNTSKLNSLVARQVP